MPTLLELFESKKYLEYNNQTAKEYNEIKNSKDSSVESLDPVVNKIGASIVNAARKKNSEIRSETINEEERTGLLVYGQAASIPLYGTEIVRIDSKTTGLVTSMRTLNQMGVGGNIFSQTTAGIAGDIAGAGVVALGQQAAGLPTTFSATGLVTKIGSKISNGVSSLLPDVLIPSKVVSIFNPPTEGLGRLGKNLTSKLYGGGMPQSPENLEAIKKAAESFSSLESVGSKLLQSATGTAEQAQNKLIAAGLSIAQEKTKKFVADKVTKLLTKRKEQSGEGSSVQKSVNLNAKIQYTPALKYANLDGRAGSDNKKPIGHIKPTEAQLDDQGGLASKYALEIASGSEFPIEFLVRSDLKGSQLGIREIPTVDVVGKYSKLMNDTMPTFETKRRIKTWRAQSKINQEIPYKPDDIANLSKTLKDIGILDDMDVIPLKFYSIENDIATNFLATITGLTETFTPTWDPNKFIGSPFSIYTYGSIERSVQFNFKVFSFDSNEHVAAWKRLSFLTSLVYPQKYVGAANAVKPPFIKFTLGDMYKNKEGFIESLIYTIDDNTPWDLGFDDVNSPTYVAKNYKLPTIIDVGVTIRILDNKNSTYTEIPTTIKAGDSIGTIGDKLYGYSENPNKPPQPQNTIAKANNKAETPAEASAKLQDPHPKANPDVARSKAFKKAGGAFKKLKDGKTVALYYLKGDPKQYYYKDGAPTSLFDDFEPHAGAY
jgi:hypothetical protein